MAKSGLMGRLSRILTERDSWRSGVSPAVMGVVLVAGCLTLPRRAVAEDLQWWALGTFIQPLESQSTPEKAILHKRASAAGARADKLYRQGKRQDALKVLDKVVAETPEIPNGYWVRAAMHHRASDFPKALADYRMVARLSPDAVGAHMKLGLLYAKTNRPGEAIAAYRRAMAAAKRRYQDIARYWRSSGYARTAPHVTETTLLLLRRERDRTIAKAYLGQGQVHFARSRYEEASNAYGDAIIAMPDYTLPYKYRGWLKEKTGHLKEARADYRKAAELDEADPWTIKALKRVR